MPKHDALALQKKFNRAAQTLGVPVNFKKEKRFADLTTLIFRLANSGIVPLARREEAETWRKIAMTIFHQQEKIQLDGVQQEETQQKLERAFMRELLLTEGMPQQVCRVIQNHGDPVKELHLDLMCLDFLSMMLDPPTEIDKRIFAAGIMPPSPDQLKLCLDYSGLRFALKMVTESINCAEGLDYLGNATHFCEEHGATSFLIQALKQTEVMHALLDNFSLSLPSSHPFVVQLFRNTLHAVSALKERREEAFYLSSLMRIRGSEPFVTLLKRYHVEPPGFNNRNLYYATCILLLESIQMAWSHELGFLSCYDRCDETAFGLHMLQRATTPAGVAPDVQSWPSDFVEAHLMLLTKCSKMIPDNPETLTLYPLPSQRHVAVVLCAIHVAMSSFHYMVDLVISKAAADLKAKADAGDMEGAQRAFLKMGFMYIWLLELLHAAESIDKRSYTPLANEFASRPELVRSICISVITFLQVWHQHQSTPFSRSHVLANLRSKGVNTYKWAAAASVALELLDKLKHASPSVQSLLSSDPLLDPESCYAGLRVMLKNVFQLPQQTTAQPSSSSSSSSSATPDNSSSVSDQMRALAVTGSSRGGETSSVSDKPGPSSSSDAAVGEGDMKKEVLKKERECAHCGKVGRDLKRCSGCHLKFWCGAECQKAGWSRHKAECRAAAKQQQS